MLMVDGGSDSGVAVAHVTHVVNAVKEGIALFIIHVLGLGAHNLQRVLLEDQLAGGTDVLLPELGGALLAGHRLPGEVRGPGLT